MIRLLMMTGPMKGIASMSSAPEFPELEEAITNAIKSCGGYVFPKLNWSSPKDASWMTVSGNLKCQTPYDIFLLLKSSDFINYDLEQIAAYEQKTNTAVDPTIPTNSSGTLVLRKWYDLQQSMEFRCFVYNHKLVGISQRDHTNFYSFLAADDTKQKIQRAIEEFFAAHIQSNFLSTNYTFDVYIVNDSWRVWLIDFGPWNESTEGLMFDWEELSPQPTWEGVCVRLVESQSNIRPTLAMTNRLPADLVDVSNGSAIDDLCRQLRGEEDK